MKFSWLFIFLGGGLGSVLRYYLTSWIDQKTVHEFPLGTMIVNMLASFVLGLIAGFLLKNTLHNHLTLFLLVGFCGGFSTFSTFSKDNFLLLEQGAIAQLAINVLISVILGIIFFFIGMIVTKGIS